MKKNYDVIIVGAGHGGCEAALATSRMGCVTALVTFNKEKIGFLSCNPAIGGVGKGQLVKELDALGGEMAKATDASCIQFRTLNKSKGAAVQSSRAQIDRKKYALYMQLVIQRQKNLEIIEDEATGLIVQKKRIKGIELSGNLSLYSKIVILAPGTFLNGLMHIGMKTFEGGRN